MAADKPKPSSSLKRKPSKTLKTGRTVSSFSTLQKILKKEKAYLDQLFEHSQLAIVMSDTHGYVCSPGIAHITTTTTVQTTGIHWDNCAI